LNLAVILLHGGVRMPTHTQLFQLDFQITHTRNFAITATDEYGRPFIILKEQQAKARVKGLEAVKVRSCCFSTNCSLQL
jgi:hypothetical protein